MYYHCKLLIANQTFWVSGLVGLEGISRFFRFKLELDVDKEPNIKPPTHARLQIFCKETLLREIVGSISHVTFIKTPTHAIRCQLVLATKLVSLSQHYLFQVFVDKRVTEVASGLLQQLDFLPQQIIRKLAQEEPVVPMLMQYQYESCAYLFRRLLARQSLCFCLDSVNLGERCYLLDADSLLELYPVKTIDKKSVFSIRRVSQLNKLTRLWLSTDVVDVRVGQQVRFSSKHSPLYLIVGIKHQLTQNSYRNWLCLHEASDRFKARVLVDYPPSLLVATIDGGSEYSPIDEQGCYRVKFESDKSNNLVAQASSAIPYMSAYTGWHMPLLSGTEVLVSFIDGDSQQPMIIGALPKGEAKPELCQIVTAAGNALVFDTTPGKREAVLQTAMGHDHIKFTEHSSGHRIEVISQNSLRVKAGKSLQYKVGGDYQVQAVQAISYLAKQKVTFISQGDMTIHSGSHCQVLAGRDIYLQSRGDFNLKATSAEFQAGSDIVLTSSHAGVQLSAGNQLSLTTQQGMELQVTDGVVIFQSQGTGIRIDKNSVTLFGPSVGFSGEVIHTGQVVMV